MKTRGVDPSCRITAMRLEQAAGKLSQITPKQQQAMGLILVTQIVESGSTAGELHEPIDQGRVRRDPSRGHRAKLASHRRQH